MPARVHAILVVRPEGRTPAAQHLRRTLAALRDQTRPVDALTIVLCGADHALTEIAAASGAEGIITASSATSFAAAVSLATPRLGGELVWLLAQDTAPEPEALARLAGALELSASVGVVAPKLVRWDDRSEIVSLGVTMTRYGRAMELAAGELDQGQHDVAEDVLGADVRGMLVRRETWTELRGLDTALAGADEGLDLSVRARLAGGRVTLVPLALVAVAGDGVAGVPDRRAGRRAFAERTAQLHRRLAYAPAVAVPAHWLSLIPLALWRTVSHLLQKEPGKVGPEWLATLLVVVRWGAVARARARIRPARRVPWARLAPLRVTREQLRLRWEGDGADADAPVRSDLHFFTGGGAWAVLGALVVSVAAFPALLAWPVLGGGALAPLRSTVAQLWMDAAYGPRALGLGESGPADPFAAVVAIIGTLSPFEPSRALVVLWVLALPLAVLGGWFAATRVTERSLLRITGAIAWALAPTFLAALTEGRPAALLAHLLLPWLFCAASVAHRSWAAAGTAAVLVAAVLACAPSLGPAFVVLWVAMLLMDGLVRRGRGAARIVWLLVPAAVFFAPVVWRQVRAGNPWGLLADPGLPFAGAVVGADPAGRALLTAGYPLADAGGWSALIGGAAVWIPLLSAPIAVAALLSLLTPRWVTGTALLIVTATGLATAFAVVGVSVAHSGLDPVAVWPGSALSLAWLGATGAAVVALDAGLVPRLRIVRPIGASLILVALAVAAVPALTALPRGTSALENGPASTLPAYVAAQGRGDPRLGTLVLDPRPQGVIAEVVWGGSETLGGQSTVTATRSHPDVSDDDLAALVVDLATPSAEDVVSSLAERGIGFVLLTGADESEATGQTVRLAAATSLDQRDALDAVGETARGSLWRVVDGAQARPEADAETRRIAGLIAAAQIAVILVSLLLAVPTGASRRLARRSPRTVGPVLPEMR